MQNDAAIQTDAFLTPELVFLALESAGIGVWKIDTQTRSIDLSSAMRRVLEFPIHGPIEFEQFLSRVDPEDRQRLSGAVAEILKPDVGGPWDAEFRLTMGDAESAWFAISGRACLDNSGPEHRSRSFAGTIRNVTARKSTAAAQIVAAERRDDLLHEVNHRVKNSLQLVSSLLRLQARRARDVDTRRELDDATARISTIARIHDRLYRDKNTQYFNFGAFVHELCSDLQGSAPTCSLQVNSADLRINTDRAVPWALILTELVGRAFASATDAGGGPVNVTVAESAGATITMSVSCAQLEQVQNSSIVLKNLRSVLIEGLVQQLAGELTVHDDRGGATISVTAPIG